MKTARKLWIVTALTRLPLRDKAFMDSWQDNLSDSEVRPNWVVVWNGANGQRFPYEIRAHETVKERSTLIIEPDYLGVVPAFCLGLHAVINRAAPQDIIVCLHDDVEIFEQDWDLRVIEHFDAHPNTCLAGFFGATGLGAADIYKTPYDPMQLARMDCWSNMDDALAHGSRCDHARRVVCLDGFSQIMSVDFARYALAWLDASGITHHFYDGILGCLAARYRRDYPTLAEHLGGPHATWMIPIHCHHAGGQTAVGDPGYQAWAKTRNEKGDQGFWEEAHRIGYEAFRDVLPLRLKD